MAMNREQKRAMRKAGEVGEDGEPIAKRPKRAPTPPPSKAKAKEERTSPRQFVKEVRQELRKVAWPTRSETINFSLIVIVTLIIMTGLIFALDWLFAKGVLDLYNT